MPVRALYAEIVALPQAEARVAELLRTLTRDVRAEPGNLEFVCYTVESDPRRFFVYEVYRDEAAFQAHLRADYGAVFNAELASLVEGGRSQLTYLLPLGNFPLAE